MGERSLQLRLGKDLQLTLLLARLLSELLCL